MISLPSQNYEFRSVETARLRGRCLLEEWGRVTVGLFIGGRCLDSRYPIWTGVISRFRCECCDMDKLLYCTIYKWARDCNWMKRYRRWVCLDYCFWYDHYTTDLCSRKVESRYGYKWQEVKMGILIYYFIPDRLVGLSERLRKIVSLF
jgi:hypothetical protein